MKIRNGILLALVSLWMLGQVVYGAWMATGPYGGQAQAIAVDPGNPRILLVGTKNALLYRSDDAGESWQPLAFPSYYTATVNTIVIDPKDVRAYYVGVVDDHSSGVDNGAGIYKSTDAGRHWERQADMKGRSVFSLAISPQDTQVLAAGTREGVYRTQDGGKTWRRISPEDNPELQAIMSLAFDPVHTDTLYAGTPHLPWKTTNGGLSWQSIRQGMIDDSDVFSIRVDTTKPERVFASACSGIYRSTNGGASWAKMQGIPRSNRRTHIITQDPQHPEIVYAGTSLGLWKSVDGGVSWHKMCEYAVRSIAFDPTDSRTLYLATDRSGIFKSTDGGQTLSPINRGFANRNITQFTVAGSNGRDEPHPTLYVSTIYDGDFGGLFQSDGAARGWSLLADQTRLLNENLLTLAVSASDDKLIFAASYNGLLKSTDGGRTWASANTIKQLVAAPEPARKEPVKARSRAASAKAPAVAKKTPHVTEVPIPFAGAKIYVLKTVMDAKPWLFAGTSMGLFASDDNGESWQPVPITADQVWPIYRIILPAHGLHKMVVMTSGGPFFSDDRGRSWRPWPRRDKDETVYDIALHSSDPQWVLAATSRGLLKSTDGGATWALRGGGLPVAEVITVAQHPVRTQEVYVVQYGKVYRSRDGGDSWEPFDSAGLEHTVIRQLVLSPKAPDQLYALSVSQGIYVNNLPQ